MPGPSGECCGKCYFWWQPSKHPDDASEGLCRRYPPHMRSVDGEQTDDQPWVLRDDWCGEFKPKAPTTAENPMLDLPIGMLDLPNRAKNALTDPRSRRGPIKTIRELVGMTEPMLLARRGLGETSFWQIKRTLAEHGLCLSDGITKAPTTEST